MNKSRSLWISCDGFTCIVDVDGKDIIIAAAPIVGKFKGQPLNNLLKWIKKKWGIVDIYDYGKIL